MANRSTRARTAATSAPHPASDRSGASTPCTHASEAYPIASTPLLWKGHGSEGAGDRGTDGFEHLGPPCAVDGTSVHGLLARILGATLPAAEPWEGAGVLLELSRSSASELCERTGTAPDAGMRLAAAFELGRRVERARFPVRKSLGSAHAVHALLKPEVRGLAREVFFALLLDGKLRLQRWLRVSEGTLTSSLVHPREVFRAAIREGAAAIIAAHNHPSGDPEPSAEDVETTQRLRKAGELLGIPLVDHVVLGAEGYVSLRERMGFGEDRWPARASPEGGR